MHLSLRNTRLTWFSLGLFIVALAVAACMPGTPALPTPTVILPTATVAPPTSSDSGEIPAGVDADGNFYRGNPNATVKLVEFSDFQCPFCSRHAQQTEPQLKATYIATGQVLHVFRHYPIPQLGHTYAIPAAAAAYCAGQQAPTWFWAMHDWLFANQQTWGQAQDAPNQFRQQAIALGADAARYDACVADPATEARIQRDVAEGSALGVSGTPAFFVNEWFIEGAYPFTEFQDKIAKATQGLRPPPTPTPLPAGVEFFDADPARPGFTYDGSPSLGASDARLVLISFEDFKSTAAAQHVSAVEPTLKTRYVDTNQLRLVLKFFPDTAPQAAAAALCAARQGKFWDYRGLLYAKQAEWQVGDTVALTGYARDLGLDRTTFDTCLADEGTQAEIDTAFDFGRRQIGVPATPSFLLIKLSVTGQMEDVAPFAGAQTLDVLEQKIAEYLQPEAQVPTPDGSISAEKLASLPVGSDANGNFYRGDLAAPIRLIDFSDFQCPFCGRHATQTGPFLDEAYIAAGKVVHIFRHLPLTGIHPNALPASQAAYCAGQQDPQLFWALHGWLFANQNTWSNARDAASQFRQQALALGADAARYDACLTDAATQAAIQRDMDEASRLGIRSTPTFVLQKVDPQGQPQGKEDRVVGALPYQDFAKKIEDLLAAQGSAN